MKNTINIKGNNQTFPYILEYTTNKRTIENHSVGYAYMNNCVCLYNDDIRYYRYKNEWLPVDSSAMQHLYIPELIDIANIRIYIPSHAISSYLKGFKYAINAHTWINGKKIDLGSIIFGPNDVYAYEFGPIKYGNNEYYSCIDFDIIDVFNILYDDEWIDFRHNICNEPLNSNSTVPPLYMSLNIVNKNNSVFSLNNEYSGDSTCFNISKNDDFLKFNISETIDPLGFKFDISVNRVYNWFLTYISETYGIVTSHNKIRFDLAIKNKNSIIEGPSFLWNADEDYGRFVQTIKWQDISNDSPFKIFFNDWNTFEEGWNIIGSLNIINDDHEIFTLISNEVPITQEVFSRYTNNGSEKIIDLSDMNIVNYNLVNKIENNIVQIERPNESKSNMLQSVFFRVSETELLTLHPEVNENISIQLDEYKSKTDKFILQINGCKFYPIGESKYGTIFKISANALPADTTSGTYYILNGDLELITTGKYNCVR